MTATTSDNRVLIVEPDQVVRSAVAEYLRECGYRVAEAVSTDEAVEVLSHAGITMNAVLVTVDSPGAMDGFGLAKWARQSGIVAEVILVGTASKAVEEAAELCEEGPRLTKPYDHSLLLDRIKRSLASRKRDLDP